ncbi:MAG: hypothetical protein JO346_07745, partial [Alphaproteobacteria bacterium]|nr:hypothetical protein [Alphaproteobacteria bacterium]
AVIAIVSDWNRSPEHSVACAEAEKRSMGQRPHFGGGLFALIVGGICLVLGAHFAALGAMAVAELWRLPVSVVSVTVLALGASLPVLIVTAIAALRGHTEIAIGHMMTASVFNLFGALGVAAIVKPLTIPQVFGSVDVFVVLGASALLVPLLLTNWRLSRPKGALLMLGYICYIGFIAWRQGLLPQHIPFIT